MTDQDYHIIPYNETHHAKAFALEKGIVQGNKIQLEIIKDHFLDRAKIFKDHYCCLAVTRDQEVIGSAMGAKTTMIINDEASAIGIAFDTKVHPSVRGNGVGGKLVQGVYQHFFNCGGLAKNFMIAKQSNAAVVKLASNAVSKIWLYDFVYLTLPTTMRVKVSMPVSTPMQLLQVRMFDEESIPTELYSAMNSGLSYFNTHKIYRLKIRKISWLYKQGLSLMKLISPKYAGIPAEKEAISSATLYNHNPENIQYINQVLQELESKGIKMLLVCCRKNDDIYNSLRKASINCYPYNIVSDFPIDKNDQIVIDVRCL